MNISFCFVLFYNTYKENMFTNKIEDGPKCLVSVNFFSVKVLSIGCQCMNFFSCKYSFENGIIVDFDSFYLNLDPE